MDDRKRAQADRGSPPEPTDDPRDGKQAARGAILARRARFVAAALASAGLASAGYACTCLSVVRQPDGPPTVDTEPSATTTGDPTAADGPVDAGATDDGTDDPHPPEDGAPPRPCLKPARPQICLSDDQIEGEIIDPKPEICLEAPFDDVAP